MAKPLVWDVMAIFWMSTESGAGLSDLVWWFQLFDDQVGSDEAERL